MLASWPILPDFLRLSSTASARWVWRKRPQVLPCSGARAEGCRRRQEARRKVARRQRRLTHHGHPVSAGRQRVGCGLRLAERGEGSPRRPAGPAAGSLGGRM